MPTNSRSIFCASMHKAGSSITDDILVDFCRARGLAMDRISLIAPSSPLSEGEVFVNYQPHMKPEGVYYGVARGPYVARMPVLRQLKVIVQMRDPRDCITSGYFSLRQSHEPPEDPEKRKQFMARRREMQDLDINQYAVSQAGSYRSRMQILRELIEGHGDILVLKYEDMVLHTEDWLGRIADFIGQPVTGALRAALGDKIDFSVRSEDPARHKRQVAPGDHRRKLEARTIAALNARMAEQMAFFGYGDEE